MGTGAEQTTVPIRDTPKVREWPVLGSLPGMAADPAQYFVRCYRKYGPVFDMSLLGQRYKALCGASAANFMNSHEGRESLRSREFWQGLVDEYGAKNTISSVDGEQHSELRRLLRHGYSRESIKGRYNELIDITDQAIEQDWRTGEWMPVVQSFQFMVADQLGIMITGESPRQHVADIRLMILYMLNSLVTRQRPKFFLLDPRYKQARQRVFDLADRIKADYLADRRATDHRTLVDDIMEANRDHPDLMPDEDLRTNLIGPYTAGLDTVANTLGACVYSILKYPDVYARVQAEVDDFFATGEPVEEAGLLKRLPALNGAIMETMRLYPIAVAQIRTANKDFVFEGCQVREGEMLYTSTAVAHFLEEFYPEPDKFDIDRYAKPREEHKQPGAYSPYGSGQHTCLGKSLAEIQLLLIMARLFYKLDLSLPSPDYVLKKKTAPTPGPSMGFKIRVDGHRRQEPAP